MADRLWCDGCHEWHEIWREATPQEIAGIDAYQLPLEPDF